MVKQHACHNTGNMHVTCMLTGLVQCALARRRHSKCIILVFVLDLSTSIYRPTTSPTYIHLSTLESTFGPIFICILYHMQYLC